MAKNSSEKKTARKAAPGNRKTTARPAAGGSRPATEGSPPRREKSAARPKPLRSRPANENEPGTAALISRMRKRPSSAPLWFAFLASMMWVFAFFALFSEKLTVLSNPTSAENMPLVLTGAMILFLPIFLSFSTAYLLWRAQQMRHVSEGLVHTALRLIRPQEVAADGLMSISQSIRYDVDQLVGGIEHAMARAGELEGMVHREISNIERAFGSNEERIRTLLSGLENQRNALREAGEVISNDTSPLLAKLEENTSALGGLVNTANSTLSNIDEGLRTSSGELSATVEDFSNRATVAGNELNVQSQRMDQMSGVMVNEMRIFSESLSGQIDALATSTTKINKESNDFSHNVQGMEAKLLTALKTSSEELGTVNSEVLRGVERMTGTLSEQLTGTSSQLSELLQSTSSNLTYHLQSTSAEVAKAMEKSGIDVSQQIETSGVALSDKLLSVSGDFVGNVAQARDDLYTYLEDVSGKMTGRLSDSTKALYTEVERSTNDISDKLEQTSSVLFSRVAEATGQMSAHLDESTTRLSGSIDETSTQMVQRLETSTSRLSQLLDVASSDMTTKLEDTTTQLAGHLDKSSGDMAANLSETSSQITGQLDATAADLATQLGRSSNDMTERLATTSAEIADNLSITSTGITGDLAATSATIADNLAQTGDGLASRLDQTSAEVASRLANTSQSVTGQLETTANDLANNLESTTASVTQYFNKTTGDVTTQLADTSTNLLAQLDEAAGDMTIRLDDTTGKLSHQLNAVTDDMTGKLSDTTVRLTEQLSVAAEDMTSKLSDSTASIALRLDNTSVKMTGLLDSTTGNLTDKLDQAAYQLSERLDTTTTQFHTQLDGVSGTMLGRIESTVEDLGKRFDVSAALLEDVTGNITERFDGTSEKFTKILDTASSQILDELGSASSAFSDGLKVSTDQITGRFEETTGALATRVDKATEEIEDRTNAASRRLEEAGMKFSGHVEKANNFLSEKLAVSASTMDSQLETISTDLTTRLETTGERITKHLTTSSGMVERAVDHFNNNMDKVVHSREVQMDDLVKVLANKAEDVDTMMRNYVSVIEDSLGNAHGKSDDIARLLTAQSSAAASNLQSEIARIEATSDEQIAKAAQALGQQYEAVIGSLNGMLASSTSDFADTAQAMRATAQQVAKDIDFARNELRRTILDLPDETRNNADAMRQVVSDQITALNALADVVKRQTGLLDVSGPGVTLAPPEASPGKPEGVPSAPKQTRGAVAQKPARPATQAILQVKAQVAPQKAQKPKPVADNNALQLVRSRPASDPITSKAKRGSADLLPQLEKTQKAPSQKSKTPTSATRQIENLVSKLNSAARDLTEAFEDRLPKDLEKKFNDGQVHVYTHRLYLARGQKMYNMVKQGYTNERLIRGRIDAYIRLFERLLDTLSENSQGPDMVDACLASESGKLYLLFAQAAGRLKA